MTSLSTACFDITAYPLTPRLMNGVSHGTVQNMEVCRCNLWLVFISEKCLGKYSLDSISVRGFYRIYST